MYCTQCGAKLSDTAKFCTQCGAKVKSHEKDNAEERVLAEDQPAEQSDVSEESDTSTQPSEQSSEQLTEQSDANLQIESAAQPDELTDEQADQQPEPAERSDPGEQPDAEADSAAQPDLGARSSVEPELAVGQEPIGQPESSAEQAPQPRRSLKDSLIQFRRTTLRAVPTFVLAIVALMAAAGTAYAAYKLVTEVVIPAIEQMTGDAQGGSGQGEELSTEPAEPANEDEANSIVRVSEFLTGNPDDVVARVEKLGLTSALPVDMYENGTLVAPHFLGFDYAAASSDSARWEYPQSDALAWKALKDAGLYGENGADFYNSMMGIYFGKNWEVNRYTPDADGSTVCSAEALREQDAFDSISMDCLPLAVMDEGDLETLQRIIGLQGNIGTYWLKQGGHPDAKGDTCAFAGRMTVNDKEYLVYFRQDSGGWLLGPSSALEVIPWENAASIMNWSELYTEEEFSQASAKQQLRMIAQAVVQAAIEGNGGQRLNLRTGEVEEYIYDSEKPGGSQEHCWMNKEEATAVGEDFNVWVETEGMAIEDVLASDG